MNIAFIVFTSIAIQSSIVISHDSATKLRKYIIFFNWFMAFVFMSRGRLVTERLKAIVSALALGTLLSILIVAFLEKSWFMAVLAIIMYWLLSGIGQTLTLWALSRTEAISPFAKIVTILYFLFTLYILLFAKIVRI